MSAAQAMRMAEANGIEIGVEGTHLILNAELEPPVDVVNAIQRHKVEIIELLSAPGDEWAAEEWRALFDERAGIAEFDGGQTRAEAEAQAFDCCVVEWLDRHPEPFNSNRCAWCERPDRNGHAVILFETASYDHTWLHPGCWNDWQQNRWERAQKALATMGLKAPPKCVIDTRFPGRFGITEGE